MHFPPLVFAPDKLQKMQIENNGHTARVSFVDAKDAPLISGGPLDGTYKFSEIHFHWHSETRLNSKT